MANDKNGVSSTGDGGKRRKFKKTSSVYDRVDPIEETDVLERRAQVELQFLITYFGGGGPGPSSCSFFLGYQFLDFMSRDRSLGRERGVWRERKRERKPEETRPRNQGKNRRGPVSNFAPFGTYSR